MKRKTYKKNKKKRKPTYLLFRLGKEMLGVPSLKVLEVLENQEITEIPDSPGFIEGVFSFRGNIVPVVEIRKKLQLPVNKSSNNYSLITFDSQLNQNKAIIAAVADSVQGVIAVDDTEIEPVPEMGLKIDSQYFTGMIKRNGKFILLMNIDKVFEIN